MSFQRRKPLSLFFLTFLMTVILLMPLSASPLHAEDNPNPYLKSFELAAEDNFEEARKVFKEILESDPSSRRATNSLSLIDDVLNNRVDREAVVNTFKAYYFIDLEMWAEALEALNNALEITPDIIVVHFDRGALYMQLMQFDNAMADFSKTIELDPSYASAYFGRGITHLINNDRNTAISDFTSAIEVNPAMKDAYLARGEAHSSEGNYLRAISDFTWLIENDLSNVALAYYKRAVAHDREDKFIQAISDYTKALELGYKDNEIYSSRGMAYYMSYQYEKAIIDLTHYIELEPDNPYAYNSRAFIHEKNGRFNEAITDYTKVIEMLPQDQRAYYDRSNAYFNGPNDIEKGCADLKEACRLNECEDFSTRGHHGKKCNSSPVDKELLKAGKNPREVLVGSGIKFTGEEFIKAAEERRMDVVRLFVDAGMDINIDGMGKSKALTTATFNGHYDIVKYLIEKGADLSVTNYGGNNALMEAVRSNKTEIVKLLIKSGIDLNAIDNQRKTVLYSVKTAEMAKLLLDSGANINFTNAYGGPLNSLVHYNNVEVARVFIEHGAPINAIDKYGSTPLNQAASEGKLAIARFLVEHGADIDIKDDEGTSALEYALNNKDLDMIELLKKAGAKISKEQTLIRAIMRGKKETVKELIRDGADVNYLTLGYKPKTPLLIALNLGYTDIVKILIDNKVDINFVNDRISSPLTHVTEQGDINNVKLLIEAGADLNGGALCEFLCNNYTPLIAALYAEVDIKIIELLLDSGAKVDLMSSARNSNAPPRNALMSAIWLDSREIVNILLRHGANPLLKNEDWSAMEIVQKEGRTEIIALFEVNIKEREAKLKVNRTAMKGRQKRALKKLEKTGLTYNAKSFLGVVGSGDIKKIKLFLKAGMSLENRDIEGETALTIAVRKGNMTLINELINLGADINTHSYTGATPLSVASGINALETAALLLKRKANIDSVDARTNTPLSIAIQEDHNEMAHLLLNNGADPNFTGHTLWFSIYSNDTTMVKILLDKGVDPNIMKDCKFSCDYGMPMISAIIYNYIETVKLLISYGADVNVLIDGALNGNSGTALMIASANGHREIVKLLLANNADPNGSDYDGNTALLWAANAGETEIVKLLIAVGANLNARGWSGSALENAREDGNKELINILEAAAKAGP